MRLIRLVRHPGVASTAILLGIGAGLVSCSALAPDWSRRVGLDVWNMGAEEQNYRSAVERKEYLGATGDEHIARRAAARSVALKLIDGSETLSAAADQLSAIFRPDRGWCVALELHYPAVPDERHRFARSAIERVRGLLDDPTESARVLHRLEEEYRAIPPAPVAARSQ
jgi:hypothetical protein